MRDLNTRIGDAVRQRRLEKGLSVGELAACTEGLIDPVTLGSLEAGQGDWTVPMMEGVANALGVAVAVLMSGAEPLSARIYQLVGSRVRSHRDQRARTVASLADSVGIKGTELETIEAGEGRPTLRTVARLAEALDMSLSALFRAETERKPGLSAVEMLLIDAHRRRDVPILLAICREMTEDMIRASAFLGDHALPRVPTRLELLEPSPIAQAVIAAPTTASVAMVPAAAVAPEAAAPESAAPEAVAPTKEMDASGFIQQSELDTLLSRAMFQNELRRPHEGGGLGGIKVGPYHISIESDASAVVASGGETTVVAAGEEVAAASESAPEPDPELEPEEEGDDGSGMSQSELDALMG